VSTYEDDGDDKPKRVILGKEILKKNDKEVLVFFKLF
jgi:hypothetical protein